MLFKIYRLIIIILIIYNPVLKSQLYINKNIVDINLGTSGYPLFKIPLSTLYINTSRMQIY
jgi:hypothetical protein